MADYVRFKAGFFTLAQPVRKIVVARLGRRPSPVS
jgi:hypothetical protein